LCYCEIVTTANMPNSLWGDSSSEDEFSLPPIPKSWKKKRPIVSVPLGKKTEKKNIYSILTIDSDSDSE